MFLKTFFTSIVFFIILFEKTKNEIPMNIDVSAKKGNTNENCSHPCLSICEANTFKRFNTSENLKIFFEKEIKFYKNYTKLEDLSIFFNTNVSRPCNTSLMYPLKTSRNDKWSIYEDGIVYVHYDKTFRNQQQYCFDWIDMLDGDMYQGSLFVPYICSLVNNSFGSDQWKNWAMVFSLPFFLSTICFYCFLPELKSCHGKCFIMYLTYLTLTYGLLSYANLSPAEFTEHECLTIGFIIYFTTIAFLTWLSIISYDTYATLTLFNYSVLFRKYFCYGTVIPLLTTFLAFVAQNTRIEDAFKPGIAPGSCAVQTKRWSAMLYYYVPHITVLIFCLFNFIKLIIFLQHHEKNATKYAGKMKTSYKKRFTIYFRLFIFMGVIWFVEILSYITYMILGEDTTITVVSDYFIALHGLFIFLCIICSSHFCNKTMEKFTKKRCAEHELITTASMDGSLEEGPLSYLNRNKNGYTNDLKLSRC